MILVLLVMLGIACTKLETYKSQLQVIQSQGQANKQLAQKGTQRLKQDASAAVSNYTKGVQSDKAETSKAVADLHKRLSIKRLHKHSTSAAASQAVPDTSGIADETYAEWLEQNGKAALQIGSDYNEVVRQRNLCVEILESERKVFEEFDKQSKQ